MRERWREGKGERVREREKERERESDKAGERERERDVEYGYLIGGCLGTIEIVVYYDLYAWHLLVI
jgi:hypothetical protein